MADSKMLYLLRHAKSSWRDPQLIDARRPLNKRGRRDAPEMGRHLAALGVNPRLVISSPAMRALTTARTVAAELGVEPDAVTVEDALYCFDAGTLEEVVRRIDDRWERVMLVGHNPAITDFVNVAAAADIENVPTCGFVALAFETPSWARVGTVMARLGLFEYPKKLRNTRD